MSDGVSWRKVDGTLMARMDISAVPFDRRLHGLPLGKLLALTREHLDRRPNARIRYLHKVSRIDQSEKSCARVFADTPNGEQVFEADYIVGCDGANSTIRRALFGEEFPGRTWDEQIVATNVRPHPFHLFFSYYDQIHPTNPRLCFTLLGWLRAGVSRYIMMSQSTAGGKVHSSSTRNISLLSLCFRRTGCIASVTARRSA